MNISQAAQQTGLSSKTIRYYESIDLVHPASRGDNGYRVYREKQVRQLRFIHHARELDFTLDECRELLELYNNNARKSADVKAITLEKITSIDAKINHLKVMRDCLAQLTECCHGDDQPDCPILDRLADH
ncbi:Cu(I)-responsive transcriptional regulator [Endozoicomonas sp. (ex Bugula neritina AB1)]|nr:Cu(I)-responsive transcriptional regulator [Endozoicomonas sp. (ex Bugula neritina AB1)]